MKHHLFFILISLSQLTYAQPDWIFIDNQERPATPPLSTAKQFYSNIKALEPLITINPDSAIIALEKTYRESKALNFQLGVGVSSLYLGNAFLRKGHHQSALAMYDQAVTAFERSGKGRQYVPNVFNNIANVYHQQKDYIHTLEYFHKALHYADSLQLSYDRAALYQNMGGLLTDLEQTPEQAVSYIDKSMAIARKNKNWPTFVRGFVNKSYVYYKAAQWDSALYYSRKAYHLAGQHQLPEVRCIALINIGSVQAEMDSLQAARNAFSEALRLRHVASPYHTCKLYLGLGDTYRKMTRHDSARYYLQLAAAGSEQYALHEISYYVHRSLALLYNAQGQPTKAYQHLEQYIHLKDSVESADIKNKLNYLEARYSVSKKNEEIMKQALLITAQGKNLREKNYLLLLVCTVVAGAVLFFFLNRRHRKKHQIQIEKSKRQQAEIDLLNASISGEEKERKRIANELHDGLGGLMSALKLQVNQLERDTGAEQQEKNFNRLDTIITALHAEMRKTAYNLSPNLLLQNQLLQAVNLYCHQIGQAAEINIRVQAIGAFDALPYHFSLTVYRIIQELVHNIVKHSEAQNALVQLVNETDLFMLTVEDDGKGYDERVAHTGLGLKNVESRVKAFQGSMDIRPLAGAGTTITIEYPRPEGQTQENTPADNNLYN